MPLHVAARVHAFVHGLFRPSDELETRQLYGRVIGLFDRHGLRDPSARHNLIASLAEKVFSEFSADADHSQIEHIAQLIERVFEYEELFVIPVVDWSERRSITEYWVLRDQLNIQRKLVEDFQKTRELLRLAFIAVLQPIYTDCPALLHDDEDDTGITLPTDLIRNVGDIGSVTETVLGVAFASELEEARLFLRHAERLERNLVAASGGNPADPKGFNKTPKLPTKPDIKDPASLVTTYLDGTPLLDFFDQKVNFTIPTRTRFEHHWIISPPGGGKSTMLQYLLLGDFQRVARNEASVIVIDSNRDLAKSIERLKWFAKGGALEDRLILIDVEDVEYPVAISIFDTQTSDTEALSPRDREVLYNSSVSMLSYIFHALLGAEMTSRQSTLFNFTIELLLTLPSPTLDTLIDVVQPDGLLKFADYIPKLSPDAQRFFDIKFNSKEFTQTKSQVVDRLFAVKRIRALSRIFSSPKTKLNLFDELSQSKIIVINAAKSVLQEDGVEIFTRFFLANIMLAAEKRQLLPKSKRLNTYLYIDECQDVIRRDERLPVVLDQARKLRLACVLANQRLGQMSPPVLNALFGSTAIKFAANLADANLGTLASSMRTTSEFLQSQQPFHFGAYVRGATNTAISIKVPHVDFDTMEHMSDDELEELREVMRERYAVHHADGGNDDPAPNEPEPLESEDEPEEDSGKTSEQDNVDTSTSPDW